MTEIQRNLVTAGLVCGAAAAVVGGIATREWVDMGLRGSAEARGIPVSALIASRTADPATEIPEVQYFEQMTLLLKREYVEPIKDEVSLANGAVRGMVSSLEDERCMYLDERAMKVAEGVLQGRFEGIGVELTFVRNPGSRSTLESEPPPSGLGSLEPSRVPKLIVAFVVPGGPASRAGVRVGDEVDSVDGKWVVNPDMIDRVRLTQRKVESKEWPASKLNDLRIELREKSRRSMSPYRAYERLTQGTSGALDVTWKRGNDTVATRIAKAACSMRPLVRLSTDTFRLRLWPGVEEELTKAVAGKAAVTLDLRGASFGDLRTMRECLAALGPAGSYGFLTNQSGPRGAKLEVAKGNPKPPKLTLLVDRYTRGVSEAFALALASKGLATLKGGPTARDPAIVELRRLPEGTGYTLVTGVYNSVGGQK